MCEQVYPRNATKTPGLLNEIEACKRTVFRLELQRIAGTSHHRSAAFTEHVAVHVAVRALETLAAGFPTYAALLQGIKIELEHFAVVGLQSLLQCVDLPVRARQARQASMAASKRAYLQVRF